MRGVLCRGICIAVEILAAATVITGVVALFVAVGLVGHEVMVSCERPSVQDGPVAVVPVNGGEYRVAVFPTPATTLASNRQIDIWLEGRSGSEVSRKQVPTSEWRDRRDFTAVVFTTE